MVEVILNKTPDIDIEFQGSVLWKKPQEQAQADWNETDEEKPSFIKNKPDVVGDITNAIEKEIKRADEAYDAKGSSQKVAEKAQQDLATAIEEEVKRADNAYDKKGTYDELDRKIFGLEQNKADKNNTYTKGETIDVAEKKAKDAIAQEVIRADKAYAHQDNTYTKEEVDKEVSKAVGSTYIVKGSVNNFSDLKNLVDVKVGYTYNVINAGTYTPIGGDKEEPFEAGSNFVATISGNGDQVGMWDKLGGAFDTSNLVKQEQLLDYATKADLTFKQDKLKSQENIKSINGESLLGSGDLKVITEVPNEVEITKSPNPPYDSRTKIWVNLEEDAIGSEIVPEAPKDGKSYYRKDGAWYVAVNDNLAQEEGISKTKAMSQAATSEALGTKQPMLVNKQNIKSINGQSILGSGNLEIAGGSGGSIKEVEVSDVQPTDPNNIIWVDMEENQPGVYIVEEAPKDGQTYGRKDKTWVVLSKYDDTEVRQLIQANTDQIGNISLVLDNILGE